MKRFVEPTEHYFLVTGFCINCRIQMHYNAFTFCAQGFFFLIKDDVKSGTRPLVTNSPLCMGRGEDRGFPSVENHDRSFGSPRRAGCHPVTAKEITTAFSHDHRHDVLLGWMLIPFLKRARENSKLLFESSRLEEWKTFRSCN
jgi:hypothetical protein